MYEPEENPLKGLHAVKDAEEINEILWDYMCMWRDDDSFRDINKVIEAGDIEMLADHLVSAGAVDSSGCVRTCAAIERRIEKLSKQWQTLTKEDQNKRYDEAFKDCTVYICSECSHHEFVGPDDFMSEKEMQSFGCASCDRKNTFKAHKWGEAIED